MFRFSFLCMLVALSAVSSVSAQNAFTLVADGPSNDQLAAVRFSPSGTAYISSFGQNVLYTPFTGNLLSTVGTTGPQLSSPTTMTFNGNSNNLFIGNFGTSTIVRLNPADNSLTQIATVTRPSGMVFLNNELYVVSETKIVKIDAATASSTAGSTSATGTDFITGLPAVNDLAFASNGDLFITAPDSNRILRVASGSTTSTDYVASLAFKPRSIVFASNGDMYIGADTGNIYRFAAGSTTPIAHVQNADTSFSVTFIAINPASPNVMYFTAANKVWSTAVSAATAPVVTPPVVPVTPAPTVPVIPNNPVVAPVVPVVEAPKCAIYVKAYNQCGYTNTGRKLDIECRQIGSSMCYCCL